MEAKTNTKICDVCKEKITKVSCCLCKKDICYTHSRTIRFIHRTNYDEVDEFVFKKNTKPTYKIINNIKVPQDDNAEIMCSECMEQITNVLSKKENEIKKIVSREVTKTLRNIAVASKL